MTQEVCLELCKQIDKALLDGDRYLALELAVQVRPGAIEVDKANPDYQGACTRLAESLLNHLTEGRLTNAEASVLILQMILAPDPPPQSPSDFISSHGEA